jgi:hypothetical protein
MAGLSNLYPPFLAWSRTAASLRSNALSGGRGIVPFRVEDEGRDGGFMISRGDGVRGV